MVCLVTWVTSLGPATGRAPTVEGRRERASHFGKRVVWIRQVGGDGDGPPTRDAPGER